MSSYPSAYTYGAGSTVAIPAQQEPRRSTVIGTYISQAEPTLPLIRQARPVNKGEAGGETKHEDDFGLPSASLRGFHHGHPFEAVIPAYTSDADMAGDHEEVMF